MGAHRLLVLCAAIATTAACGIGVAGLEGVAGDAAAPGVDAQADGTSPGESSTAGDDGGATESGAGDGPTADVVVGADVVSIEAAPVDGCTPTGPENCTNGVDDNCNGLVDCADPECTTQGYTCVPPAPSGWDFVAFDPTSQPGCPSSLNANDVDVDPTNLASPATCSCACNPAGVTCYGGQFTASGGTTGTCNLGSKSYTASSACASNTDPLVAYAQVTEPPLGGSCTPSATTSVPPTGATQGQYCSGENAFGAGCTGGQVCALAPSGTQTCVHHGGQASCPGGGYATANHVGTIDDSRGCSACNCNGAPTGTCSGTWSFYEQAGCTGTKVSLTVDGDCDATNAANTQYPSDQLEVTASNVACGAPSAQSSPTGSVQLSGADTICCP